MLLLTKIHIATVKLGKVFGYELGYLLYLLKYYLCVLEKVRVIRSWAGVTASCELLMLEIELGSSAETVCTLTTEPSLQLSFTSLPTFSFFG